MADTKIPDLTELTSVADDDLLVINDTSDTSGSAAGTVKYIQKSNLVTGLGNVVEDTTPQLGGNLDVNGNSIVSVSDGNIAITPDGTGAVVLDTNLEVTSNDLNIVSGSLDFNFSGNQRFTLSSGNFVVHSNGGNGPSIEREDPSDKNPVYTFLSDKDTGIGTAGADILSLIAGGQEGVRITESGDAITEIALNGYVKLPSYTDANRGAAGTAGRVIFNTDDANINIDDGTNWILPDGTTT